ncbi:MAG: hypothetical protein HEQ13_14735 [Dolichospermum sp. DEX189]|nr:hypothetical protein [Dolichospermum sp. DEX189]
MRFQWRTADAIAMSSIFRKGKYRLVWLVLAIALGLSTIIPVRIAIASALLPAVRFSPNSRSPGNFCIGW